MARGAGTPCYRVNPCSRDTEDLCRPCGSKRSTWAHHSHCTLFGELRFLQHSKPRWAKMKDSLIIFNLMPRLHLGPLCSVSCKGSGQRWQGQGSEPSATVKQKCHFRAEWDSSRRLAEISVLPIAPCLRRSASVPEILCLRRQTRCPQAMARLP